MPDTEFGQLTSSLVYTVWGSYLLAVSWSKNLRIKARSEGSSHLRPTIDARKE